MLVASAASAVIALVGLAKNTHPSRIKQAVVEAGGLDPSLVEVESDMDTTLLLIHDEDVDLDEIKAEVDAALIDLEVHRELYSHRWQ